LHCAAANGAIKVLCELLRAIPDTFGSHTNAESDYRDSMRNTPLHIAVKRDNIDAARLLRQKRPLWEMERNAENKTPLQYAVSLEARMVMAEVCPACGPEIQFRKLNKTNVQEVPIVRSMLSETFAPGLCSFVTACAGGAICNAFLRPVDENLCYDDEQGECSMESVVSEVDIVDLDLEPVSVETKAPIVKWRGLPNNGSQYTHGISKHAAQSHMGRGAYGLIWLARSRRDPEHLFAVKNITTGHKRMAVVARREWELARRIRKIPHPCIVELVSVHHFVGLSLFMMVMEYCPSGTILEKVHANALLPEYHPPALSIKWLSQVFLGLEHLHSANMLLRDLKPDNVVLDAHQRAKLTDFGLGRFGAEAPAVWSFNFPPGSPGYISPEIIARKKSDVKADLYSFGVVMWVVLTGGTVSSRYVLGGPFPPGSSATPSESCDFKSYSSDFEKLRWAINNPERFDARPLPTPKAKELVLALTQQDPSKRPSHQQIRVSSFFAELSPPFPPGGSDRECIENWLCAHGFF